MTTLVERLSGDVTSDRQKIAVSPAQWWRRYLWIAVTLAVAATLLSVRLHRGPAGAGKPVRLAQVKRGPIAVEILATGTVQPVTRFELRYPDESAQVAAVLVKSGETTEEGQPLVHLAPEPLVEAVRRAQAQLLELTFKLADLRSGQREAKLRELELAVERSEREMRLRSDEQQEVQALGREGLASRAQQARADHDLALASLATEQAKLELLTLQKSPAHKEQAYLEAEVRYRQLACARAEAALARSVLRAPARGTILDLPVQLGTILRNGDLVAVVADLRQFRVSALVDETESGRLRVGQPVRIRSEFFGGGELSGSLERVVPNVRRERNVPSVEVVVAVPAGAWEPPSGLTVDISVQVERTADVIQVPLEAVVERSGKSIVFVYDAGHVRANEIGVGVRSDAAVEVLHGLRPGQNVVTTGNALLEDGDPVKPMSASSSGSLMVEFFR